MSVHLRSIEFEDYKLINKWRNNHEVSSLTAGHKYYVSTEVEKGWAQKKSCNRDTEIYWAICLNENNHMIGYTGVTNINWVNRSAEWHAFVIGQKEYRKLNISVTAVRLMLKYLFNDLGLNVLSSIYLEAHKSSILLGKMLGFRQNNLLQNALYKTRHHHNVIVATMLKEDFLKGTGWAGKSLRD